MRPLYSTKRGILYNGDSANILKEKCFYGFRHKINLIFTSPPFPLNRSKAYGNLNGQDYIEWLSGFGPIFEELLAPDGSLVIELGNAWQIGSPTISLTSIQSLIELKKKGNFHLCQEFIWNNTSKLPSPAQWVNVERIRVKDAFTRLWWLSSKPRPKADNRRVLNEYSSSMKRLLKRKLYNSGNRPSEHKIGKQSFLKDNRGAIPSNVLSIPNTVSKDPYLTYCKEKGIKLNPSRMPLELAKFFILFLTDESDIVLDPFAGSNVTGYVAEICGRRWISVEIDEIYANSSRSRFNNSWIITQKCMEQHLCKE